MAFETKYRIVGSSDVFQKITILIKEDGFAGSITDFEGAGRDFARLKIGTSSSDISACVLPSEFSFKFYAMTDFVAIELAQGQMYSFLIEVLDHLNEIIWTGWVSPEDYSEEYVSTPYVVNVRATDMLDGLKNVALGTLFGTKNTLFEVLRTALAGTRLDLRYLESISIYSNGMLSTQDDSPLTQAEVTNDTWTNFSCYDVLEAILKPFFSRVYQYRGWVIENITFKRDNYILRLFDKFGVYQSSFNSLTLKTLQNTPVDFSKFLQKSGVLNFKPALNKSKVYFFSTEQVQDSSGLTGFDKLSDWTDANNLVSWTNENGIVILRVVTEYNGSQYAVWIDGRNTSFSDDQYIQSVAYPVDPATEEDIQVSFDYKMNYPSIVILGSKPTLFFEVYLDASGTGYWWTGTEWVTTRKPLRISASPRKAWRSYEITIPTLPAAGNIYFRLHKLVKSGSEGVTEVFLTKWVSNLKAQTEKRDVYFFSQGETSVETSYKGPVFEHYISDGDVLETKGVMEVSGVLTETWNRISESEDLDIKALFLLQWLSMNQYPTAVLQGTLYQKGELIRPTDTIRDDASISLRRYIMTMWDINISNGIGNIVYREIPLEDVSGVLVTEGTAETIDQGEYLLPGSLPASAPSIPVFGPNTPVIIPTGIRLLNGDVTGDLSAATLTPSAITNKARLDTTGLTPAEILINAVKDTEDQENMTNLSLEDIQGLISLIAGFGLTIESGTIKLTDIDLGDLQAINIGNLAQRIFGFLLPPFDGGGASFGIFGFDKGDVSNKPKVYLDFSNFVTGNGVGFELAKEVGADNYEIKFYKDTAGVRQEFTYTTDGRIVIVDNLNQRGLGDADDYSATKQDYDYATKKMLTDAIGTKQNTIIGTPTEGYVATIVSGNPTWAAPSGGGSPSLGFGLSSVSSAINLGKDDSVNFGYAARFVDLDELSTGLVDFRIGNPNFNGSGFSVGTYDTGTHYATISSTSKVSSTYVSQVYLEVNENSGSENAQLIIQIRNGTASTDFDLNINKNGAQFGLNLNQKIGFWGVSPIVRPGTGIAGATFVENSGSTVNDTSTFDGYTVGQVVKALRNIGLLG